MDIHEALWAVALLGFSDTDLFATMARSTRRQNIPINPFFTTRRAFAAPPRKYPKMTFRPDVTGHNPREGTFLKACEAACLVRLVLVG